MNIRLDGKTAIVCGSSKGIGRSSAIQLAKAGASIILMARDEGALKKTLSELDSSSNQSHSYISVDFNHPKDVSEKDAYI